MLCSQAGYESVCLLLFQEEAAPLAMCTWPEESRDYWATCGEMSVAEAHELALGSNGDHPQFLAPAGLESVPKFVSAAVIQGDRFPQAVLLTRGDAPAPLRIPDSWLEPLGKACTESIRRLRMCEAAWAVGHQIHFVGASDAFRRLESQIVQAGTLDCPVLIVGERGVGKEAAAYGIHYYSPRRHHGFLAVNSALLSSELATSELFGFRQGAFTGAMRARLGKFQAANNGTLFLDEVSEAPRGVLSGLLRVLEYGEIQKLGEEFPATVDVRIVASTNKDLGALVQAGRFPADVFDRLNVFSIRVPPLRERREDIPLLTTYLFRTFAGQADSASPGEGVSPSAHVAGGEARERAVLSAVMSIARKYDFPGNIRELKSLVLRLAVSGVAWGAALPSVLVGGETDLRLRAATRDHILGVLDRTGWNKSAAARTLDVPLSTLVSKMKKLGINLNRSREENPDRTGFEWGSAYRMAEVTTGFPGEGV
jgi:transcriptional regulator with GAF, ATPase, and Fis domain